MCTFDHLDIALFEVKVTKHPTKPPHHPPVNVVIALVRDIQNKVKISGHRPRMRTWVQVTNVSQLLKEEQFALLCLRSIYYC